MIDAAVRDVMLENPRTVPPEMLLRDLVDLFVSENLQGVPGRAGLQSCSGSSPRAT